MSQRPPITWLGSKARLARRILELFQPHQTFVEVFGGSAALLLAKPPAQVEIYNDIDGSLVNFYQVLRNPAQLKRLLRALELTLYSREEFELAQLPSSDAVESARRLMVRHRQSYGGLSQQWSYVISDSAVGMASSVRRWRAGAERLLPVHNRLRNVQIECSDFREIFNRFDAPTTLFYVDPPYLSATRVSGGYPHEMSIQDHEELVQILLRLRGKAVVSAYRHELYNPLRDAGWTTAFFDVPAFTSDTRQRRMEMLWISPVSTVGHGGGLPLIDSSPDTEKSSTEPVGRAEAARRTHLLRSKQSENSINAAISDLRAEGKKLSLTAVAAKAQISREHLTRRYRYLIEQHKL
jgi:DNA adenine methylase